MCVWGVGGGEGWVCTCISCIFNQERFRCSVYTVLYFHSKNLPTHPPRFRWSCSASFNLEKRISFSLSLTFSLTHSDLVSNDYDISFQPNSQKHFHPSIHPSPQPACIFPDPIGSQSVIGLILKKSFHFQQATTAITIINYIDGWMILRGKKIGKDNTEAEAISAPQTSINQSINQPTNPFLFQNNHHNHQFISI